MKTVVFATGNPHKIAEVNRLMSEQPFEIVGLAAINCPTDLPETSDTIVGNALEKARYVYDNYGVDCFSEDTGLEVAALNGEPGVYSARYAGEHKSADDNMRLLLEKLNGVAQRDARFKTVVALILDGVTYVFEGIVNGTIRTMPQGKQGFGYDPIFQPDGYNTTFAEMDTDQKNAISHRGKAIAQLINFLTTYTK